MKAPIQLSDNTEIILSIICYSLCSGTLVLLNKLILHYLPFPSLVISFQLCAALTFIYTSKNLGYIEVDPIKWKFVLPYLFYTVAFSMGVYCNMKSLSYSNVETVIVFRAMSPCLVAFLDAIFLGREFPSARSWFALALIVLGAYGYASYDEKFQSQGYSAYMWPFLYLNIISFEMAYGKKIIRSVDLKTFSGPVLYTNLLGLFPMLLFAAMGEEYKNFYNSLWEHDNFRIHPLGIMFLLMGCVAGTGIGYSSWWCRDKVSATSFTIVGVMNKCLTVILNFMIWDKHAQPKGIACLILCLVGGTVYKQAPMKPTRISRTQAAAVINAVNHNDHAWETDSNEHEDEMELLLNGGESGAGLNLSHDDGKGSVPTSLTVKQRHQFS